MQYNSPQPNRKVKSLKYSSKFDIMVQIFFATFIIMFIAVVVWILKYSTRIDIEGPSASSNPIEEAMENFDDEQRTIDQRLILLQQEEKTPNEAKIIVKEGNDIDNNQVIDPKYFKDEDNKDKQKKFEEAKKENSAVKNIEDETIPMPSINRPAQQKTNLKPQINESYSSNITIMSKVLVGKFLTLEEAKTKQNEIKLNQPNSNPFVKKVGDIYTVQMGTYQDFATAKSMAGSLKARGYDVWIYQQ